MTPVSVRLHGVVILSAGAGGNRALRAARVKISLRAPLQVLSVPKTVSCHTKFEAEVYVLTKDEGGRHTAFFSNYR